jgi:hypothetical protein
MTWVCKPIGTGKLHPATGRTDDEHLTDVAASWCRQFEIDEQLQTTGSDHVTARLVTREGRFVDQSDPCPAPSKYKRGDAASWTGSDNENVKARQAHAAPFASSDLQ